ncbi:ATP-binding cassette domain-containing protein [Methylotuvimicrobium sp. KM1]|uniref:ATP-binding cassette domain-containing protein n=1 Tax=Methylotuvimicrobium sp. KM1 TaxID=3377707 RepID=UPI00384EB8F2
MAQYGYGLLTSYRLQLTALCKSWWERRLRRDEGKAENVSKKFCRSLKRSMLYGIEDIVRDLLHLPNTSEKLSKDEFWAVDNISFEVKRGECFGIIGRNGAGKSTLLKMLNSIFMPDKGKITIKGKVGALIEVGAGFYQMLTGRENVYDNGAILEMSNMANINISTKPCQNYTSISD